MVRVKKVWGKGTEPLKASRRNVQLLMKKHIKDLIILWIALTALVCAAINLHISLNMLGEKEK